MSFFDDNRKIGLALIIVGLLSIIGAVVGIILAFLDDDGNVTATAVGAIGSLIFGVLILLFGMNVRSGSNDKVGILSGLVRVIGIVTILSAIFSIASQYMMNDEFSFGAAVGAFIIAIIIGLILLWIAAKIAGANKNVISNILWVLLVVAFFILVILTIIAFVSNVVDGMFGDAIISICMIFVYIYALLACLSPEVKSSMGV